MKTLPPLFSAGSGFPIQVTAAPAQTYETRRAELPDSSALHPGAAATHQNSPLSHVDFQLVLIRANQALAEATSHQLEFSVDQASGSYVVKLVDQQTGTILHQYPTETLLAIAESIANWQGGGLLDQEA